MSTSNSLSAASIKNALAKDSSDEKPEEILPQPSSFKPIQVVNKQDEENGGSSSAFILGIHNYSDPQDIDLPAFVQEHQASLSFPEKLMLLLTYVEKEYPSKEGEEGIMSKEAPIAWVLDGSGIIVRNKEDLVKGILPKFFPKQSKFTSFTRKLYRWGFRQVNLAAESNGNKRDHIVFSHEHFNRNDKTLMSKMRSVTAASSRRANETNTLTPQEPLVASRAGAAVYQQQPNLMMANPAQPAAFMYNPQVFPLLFPQMMAMDPNNPNMAQLPAGLYPPHPALLSSVLPPQQQQAKGTSSNPRETRETAAAENAAANGDTTNSSSNVPTAHMRSAADMLLQFAPPQQQGQQPQEGGAAREPPQASPPTSDKK